MSLLAKIGVIRAHRNPRRPDSLNLELQEAVDHLVGAGTLLKCSEECMCKFRLLPLAWGHWALGSCSVYTLAGSQPGQSVSLCLVTGRCGYSKHGREEHNHKAVERSLSWTVPALPQAGEKSR